MKYNYFAKDLLVRYLNRNPDATASWKLTADPRGTLIVPNAGREVRVPVGTVQIDHHLKRIRRPVEPVRRPRWCGGAVAEPGPRGSLLKCFVH